MCFVFGKVVKKKYKRNIIKASLKDIYNQFYDGKGHSTEQTKKIGVYALYVDSKLMKIGRAVYGDGIFKRMSQYYRHIKGDGALHYIDDINRDTVQVEYFNLETKKDCWAAEKFLQADAYYKKEEMPWDDEINEGESE